MAPISSPNACDEARRSTAKASGSLIAASTSCGGRGWSPGSPARSDRASRARLGTRSLARTAPHAPSYTGTPARLLRTPLERRTPITAAHSSVCSPAHRRTHRHTQTAVPLHTRTYRARLKHNLTRLCTSSIHTCPNTHTQTDTSPSYTHPGTHAHTKSYTP